MILEIVKMLIAFAIDGLLALRRESVDVFIKAIRSVETC